MEEPKRLLGLLTVTKLFYTLVFGPNCGVRKASQGAAVRHKEPNELICFAKLDLVDSFTGLPRVLVRPSEKMILSYRTPC